MSEQPLEHNGDNDYTLKAEEQSVWIKVDGISVYILRNANDPHRVSVGLFAVGDENNEELAFASATSEEE